MRNISPQMGRVTTQLWDTSHEEPFPLVVSLVLLQALSAACARSVLLWELLLSS